MAGSAGGYEGGRPCDLRFDNDHGCSLCASGLHSRAGRLLLPALRPDGFLRADCLPAGCPDRRAVLGAFLLRPGDLPEGAGDEGDLPIQETWLQRTYLTVLKWALGHRVVTLLAAAVITVGSLGLLSTIPVNLFGGDGDRYLQIQLEPAARLQRGADRRSRYRDRDSSRRTVRRVHGDHRRLVTLPVPVKPAGPWACSRPVSSCGFRKTLRKA